MIRFFQFQIRVNELEQTLANKEAELSTRMEHTRMLEMTIGTLQRESELSRNDTFDLRNLERLEQENQKLADQLISVEDQLSAAKITASDYKQDISRLEARCAQLEKEKSDENQNFNVKLDQFVQAKTEELKRAEEAIIKLKVQVESTVTFNRQIEWLVRITEWCFRDFTQNNGVS